MIKLLFAGLLCSLAFHSHADSLPFNLAWTDSPEAALKKLEWRLNPLDGFQDQQNLMMMFSGKYRGFNVAPVTLRFHHEKLVQVQLRFDKHGPTAFKYWQKLVRQWQFETNIDPMLRPDENAISETYMQLYDRVTLFDWQQPRAEFLIGDNEKVSIWIGQNAFNKYQLRMDFTLNPRE